MLQELYQYALDNKLAARPGFKPKQVKAYVLLDANGCFLGFSTALKKRTLCPDIGSEAISIRKCNILAEKASIVLLLEDKQAAKHRFFLDALRSGQSVEPMFGVCLHALEDVQTLGQLRYAFALQNYKPGDVIAFSVDGHCVEQSRAYLDWWDAFRIPLMTKKSGGKRAAVLPRCLITGQATEPLRTVPKVTGLQVVGGHSSGDALFCFSQQAYCSYNLKQSNNAAVSENAMTAVNAALNNLIAQAPILCGAKMVHWYKTSVEQRHDLLAMREFGFGCDIYEDAGETGNEKVPQLTEPTLEHAVSVDRMATQEEPQVLCAARKLIESARHDDKPTQLHNQYYILLLSGAGGRIMIRSFMQGDYEELFSSLNAWFSDLRLVSPSGNGFCKMPKLYTLNIRLLKNEWSAKNLQERMAKELSGLTPQVLCSIVQNQPLPDTVAVRALAYIRSQMLEPSAEKERRGDTFPDPIACQWLKVWLMRRQRRQTHHNKGSERMKEALDRQSPSTAYHAGRMMAVYAAIQNKALGPSLGAGVVQRYYASACTTPALVIGTLAKLSQYNLEKIDKRLAAWFQKKLDDIAQSIALYGDKNCIPTTLTLEQQAEFALGYYQQRADLFTKVKASNSAVTPVHGTEADR